MLSNQKNLAYIFFFSSFLAGCGLFKEKFSKGKFERQMALKDRGIEYKVAIKESGVSNLGDIRMDLPEGYIISKDHYWHVSLCAGVYAGTAKIKKSQIFFNMDPNYSFEGYYDKERNPEALTKVLEMADRNETKVISPKEVYKLEERLYEPQKSRAEIKKEN